MEQENVQNVADEKVTENAETQTAEEKVEKTFATQEDFNEALKKELARKTRNMPSKDELKAFNEWKESQKTEAEKQTERAQEFAKLQAEKDSLEQLTKIYDAGVTGKDNVEFIQFKVSKMEGDFDENLKTYLDEHPKYLQKETEEDAPQTTGASVKKISNNAEDGVTAILKAKHPDIKF